MKKGRKVMGERELFRRMRDLWKRGQSELCEVRNSVIHGQGVYATRFIGKEEKIIEYVGELIDKDESGKRGISQHAKAVKTGDAAVYIFTLSRRRDIDGDVPWNTARLINHSCEPNCEAWVTGSRIFIHSLRDIEAGEELTFDYGFDVECYEDHRCLCGRASCVGYIVSRSQWDILSEKLEKSQKAG
ncbi:MAG: SET domain-containing protein-lysine N-methyltransferase [Armatimonadetes bacterium]|nr:SET domain-containing protein-lysine N-methyltransferase [Akkermansiaceae bacterium]